MVVMKYVDIKLIIFTIYNFFLIFNEFQVKHFSR